MPRWQDFRRAFVTGMMAFALLGTVVYGGMGDRAEAERLPDDGAHRTSPVQPPGEIQDTAREMKAAKSPRKLCTRTNSQHDAKEAPPVSRSGMDVMGTVRTGWSSVARLAD